MKKQDISENQVKNVFLAIGSNLGNRLTNIEKAKSLLLENNIDFTNTWESEILYHQSDSLFIDGEKEYHEIVKVKTKNTTQFNF